MSKDNRNTPSKDVDSSPKKDKLPEINDDIIRRDELNNKIVYNKGIYKKED